MHKIMLVDDEVVITTQLEERLMSMGYDVVGTAASGEGSVRLARELSPNLILMDIVMPGKLDGIDAAEIIKAELGIPIIFLTAYADDKFVERAKEVEPFGYILKPFNEDQIRATIEIALHKINVEQSVRKSSEEYRSLIDKLLTLTGDVTRGVRFGKRLSQSDKLKALRMVVSGIAHEYNNLFAIIQGNRESMESHRGESREVTERLNTVRKATQDGAEIVRRMYESTRQKGDRSRDISVDMRELVKKEVEFSRPVWKEMAGAKGISYDIDLDGLKEVPAVQGDPSELREVLEIIVNNALEAMPKGGRLSFRSWKKGSYVFVSVSDTGVGMSKGACEKIFDPFFTTKKSEESGLGMSLAYSMMKRHDGKIYVESKKGKGTTISLRFPIARQAVKQGKD
ncbi:MAG: response regulator [Candidatus Brocadiales bacterium]